MRPCKNPGLWRVLPATVAALAAGLVAFFTPTTYSENRNLKADESVVLYPALGARTNDGWEVEIRGCVYELESRRLLASLLRKVVGLDDDKLSRAERALFRERARLLLVDHQDGKFVSVQIAGQTFVVGPSAANGQFYRRVFLPDSSWPDSAAPPKAIDAVVVVPNATQPVRGTQVQLLPERGLSVVSDIDDTIKLSEVRDRKQLIRNTFCRPFQPVPGMSDVYRKWAAEGDARFHYVTASPWQLFNPIWNFLSANGFPSGSVLMRNFRVQDGSVLTLWKSPEEYKTKAIEPLLRRYPGRRFVLVGDSGERDPEAYATLARRYPQQVARILIRDVTGQAADAPRYRQSFAGLPAGLWLVFREPDSIADALPPTDRPSD